LAFGPSRKLATFLVKASCIGMFVLAAIAGLFVWLWGVPHPD
jgi:hypothetical protein